mmetsp:Transcript_91685/g.163186  ORF Transcript_91685/g.163186 Transcript_91685/m.163186 type:complete len:80 (-) Transcript_91685:658-897(-)
MRTELQIQSAISLLAQRFLLAECLLIRDAERMRFHNGIYSSQCRTFLSPPGLERLPSGHLLTMSTDVRSQRSELDGMTQ